MENRKGPEPHRYCNRIEPGPNGTRVPAGENWVLPSPCYCTAVKSFWLPAAPPSVNENGTALDVETLGTCTLN